MRVKLIGEPFGKQAAAGDKFRVMSQDFIMVRDDGYVVVMAEGEGLTNGASIPWLFQGLPKMGAPLAGLNVYWSAHHDGGYNSTARVFSMRDYSFDDCCMMAEDWRNLLQGVERFAVDKWPRRKWWDRGMLAAMKEIGEPRLKQWAAYRGVRSIVGWLAWRRARRR